MSQVNITIDARVLGLKDAMRVLERRITLLSGAKPNTKAWHERRGLEKALTLIRVRKMDVQPMQYIEDANIPRGTVYLLDAEPLTQRWTPPVPSKERN